MKCARHLGTGLMALAFLTGCDGAGRGSTPTQPSLPSPAATAPPAVTGEITITSISPEPGATVPVRACAPGSDRLCADQPQLTFDVVVDRDIPNAVLTVRFDQCGFTSAPVTSLTSHSRMTLTTSVIGLSDDGPRHDGVGAVPYCTLPAATTTMTVRLFRFGEPARALLTREFANAYTFVMP